MPGKRRDNNAYCPFKKEYIKMANHHVQAIAGTGDLKILYFNFFSVYNLKFCSGFIFHLLLPYYFQKKEVVLFKTTSNVLTIKFENTFFYFFIPA